jgi:chemotaxis protein methyltransferase CheR
VLSDLTLAALQIELVASDLSASSLERARRWLFSSFEVQRGLPVRQLLAHFSQSQDLWEIAPSLQGRIRFEAFNLLDDPAPFGRFDLILCRNVLSGMNEAQAIKARGALARLVAHDGALVLGMKEAGTASMPGLLPFPEAPAGVFRPV